MIAQSELALLGGHPVRGPENPLPPVFPRDIPEKARGLVQEVLDSGFTVNMTGRFEQLFAAACHRQHALCVCNCTTALHAATAAYGIGPGDDVVVGAVTDFGSVACILWQGANPVFTDVDVRTGNMTAATLEAAITPETKAVIVVHFWGLLCDLDPIIEVAKAHELIVIEDCCQTPLAGYHGQPAGSLGDCACYSFDGEKHLSTDVGGAVVSDDEGLIARARRFAIARGGEQIPGYGRRHVELGQNYSYSQMNAAVGIAQLETLPAQNARRRETAHLLTERLTEIDGVEGPPVLPDTEPIYWLYFVRFDLERFRVGLDELAEALTAEGIPGGTARYYLVPDSHTFLENRDLSGLPNAVAHLDSAYRWQWTDRYDEQDVQDMAEIICKVTDHYRR